MINARNGEGMVCSQVVIGQVVSGQTLVSHDAGAFENRQRETWKSAHMDLAWCQIRRHADRIVVSDLDVRQVQIPILLSFVHDHSQHVGQSVVHLLNASVTVGVIGACDKLAHSQHLIYSL